ncbi:MULTISPECIES: SH3 domain-containing protein [unclassified Mesorhizobium]|uniref:SH3 domain-containing protein n=1 Tax=unclassified Mesorhizobium TaxID=325217 RepID=UPI000F75EC10|nr:MULTISPECIES: SH3 domain-containing protein [unclassified Mesorhizobium]AZO32123.1 SH3 domain-containing protein [Mesorhizobium sp. M1B.F.Ca.ET.045.04.1.1]RWA65251.1 MAG: SH3 domain-containing protein [Mesorhizobium sp.]RWB21155.1 MAG: SH3 domain-containing protein [Mesorhizobium sp.]RWD98683.1 MAG: SH3 domain-containing protein [Mesorhizobium sp.]
MNEPFSFGAPERRRFAVQFGYDMRPSFWQGLQSNAHLVIAAIGTAALLGVAAVALWLALPANERQAIASAEQTVPAIPVKTKKIEPAVASAAVSVAAPQVARKADAVSPVTAVREAAIPALASNSPRWTGADAATASAAAEAPPASSVQAAEKPATQNDKPAVAAFAESASENDASAALSKVAAPAPADQSADAKKPDARMDGAQTAAIPDAKPQAPEAQPAATDAAQDKPKPQKVSAGANGRILRAVTMRSGPKKGASAIITVPAKASVQVMSCKKWCEIVYNGKHGWVWKTYLKTGT